MWPRRQGERNEDTARLNTQKSHSVIIVSVLVHHPPSLCNFRRRSYISGLNLKSVWRVWLELSRCLQVEKGSPAPPVTPVSITTTRPPAPHAHLGPILMGWNVLTTLLIYILFLPVIFLQLLLFFLIVFVFMFIPQLVRGAQQALSPPWVMSLNGGIFFLQTWRPVVSMWATTNVTIWMVGISGNKRLVVLSLFILAFLSVYASLKGTCQHCGIYSMLIRFVAKT